MGDMNEWLPLRRTFRRIEERLGRAPAPASYPARWPLLRLDRIWTRPAARLQGVFAVASGGARRASDHLPVVGHLAAEPVTGAEQA
jgi:endonuclease/exonuclease/phosphatase family metal-dependent hydrolase